MIEDSQSVDTILEDEWQRLKNGALLQIIYLGSHEHLLGYQWRQDGPMRRIPVGYDLVLGIQELPLQPYRKHRIGKT